ncbi:MAG TPA: type II toxin-antitoxin system VapC family toxin [Flavobacteriaceae bacterium]|nr:type II toxin-antitoxin system VapC family toxin [Flavobacteriaceae bacterium]
MDLLLDTHSVIWFITENNQLSTKAKRLIEEPSNICYVSIASFWEMGIKYSLGKLQLNTNLNHIFELIDQSGFTILPIKTSHILMNSTLQFHHRDPFDRLIIAQAKNEGLTLISKDRMFKNYGENLVW